MTRSEQIASQYDLIQVERLYRRAYYRMSIGDGYQPWGHDWITMWMTKPGWYVTLRDILGAWKILQKGNK